MKTTDFIREFTDAPTDGTDATMAKNSLHTIVRVASHLEGALGDNEHLPEWVEEKLGAIKEMMVTVMDYALSQHEMKKEKEDELPAFNIGDAERTMSEMIDDDDEAERKIQHLMQKYGWSHHEAMEYYYYEKHDPADWEGIEETPTPKQQALDQQRVATTDFRIGNARARMQQRANEPKTLVQKVKHNVKSAVGLKENATGGTGSSSIAVSMTALGEKGGFSKADLKKKFNSYGNSLKRGGAVKTGKR